MGMILVPAKMEVVLLTSTRKRSPVIFKLQDVQSKDTLKYFGVWTDWNVCFYYHIKETAKNTKRSTLALMLRDL